MKCVKFNVGLDDYNFDKWDNLDWDSLDTHEKICICQWLFLVNWWYIDFKIEKRHQKGFLEFCFLLLKISQLSEINKENWWLDKWIRELYKELINRLNRFEWPVYEMFTKHRKNEAELTQYISEETKNFLLNNVV